MGDAGPVREVMDSGVHDDCLADDEGGQDVKINPVHLAVDDHVAEDAEENQEVDARIEKLVGKQALWKSAERRSGQGTGGNEHQAAMEFRFFPPVNRQREGAGEADHIKERNHQERFRVSGMHLQGIEASHGDGGRDADYENQQTQRGSEPADAAMQSDVVCAHEGGLQQEKQQPTGKDCRVEIQNRRSRNGWVNQVGADGEAEAVHHHCGDQERHEEVEISIEQTAATFRCCGGGLKKPRIGSGYR